MNRLSIHFKPNGFVNSIRMTSQFLGLPLYKVNAFFVDGLLIDTGFAFGRDRFLKLLDTLHPDVVVNTHHHEDHTGNNFWIREKYGLLPLAHPKTFFYLQDPSQWVPWYRRLVWGCPHPSETGELDSKIQTKKFHFLVIPTPGHSDDHICLYEPNEGWLFSGDLFISEQVKYLREDEDIYSIIDSLKKVAALHPKKMFCSFSGLDRSTRWRPFIKRLSIWKIYKKRWKRVFSQGYLLERFSGDSWGEGTNWVLSPQVISPKEI